MAGGTRTSTAVLISGLLGKLTDPNRREAVAAGVIETTSPLAFPLECDYVHVTRYRDTTQGGALEWKVRPRAAVAHRTVLVLDDILDEGHTLVAIRRALLEFRPGSLRVAVLAEKRHDRRAAGAHAEYVGLEVEDRYVFGCGMDYKEYWRQLPAIYAVKGT